MDTVCPGRGCVCRAGGPGPRESEEGREKRITFCRLPRPVVWVRPDRRSGALRGGEGAAAPQGSQRVRTGRRGSSRVSFGPAQWGEGTNAAIQSLKFPAQEETSGVEINTLISHKHCISKTREQSETYMH